jgi:hypothetical protein
MQDKGAVCNAEYRTNTHKYAMITLQYPQSARRAGKYKYFYKDEKVCARVASFTRAGALA